MRYDETMFLSSQQSNDIQVSFLDGADKTGRDQETGSKRSRVASAGRGDR